MEPDEWQVLQRVVKKLDQQSVIDAVWRLEGLGVLAWFLGLYELPAYDELVDANTLWRALRVYRENALQELVPEVQENDIVPAGAGVRAQLMRPDGALVEDFEFLTRRATVHVLNAPSPAATASLAIGEVVAAELARSLS